MHATSAGSQKLPVGADDAADGYLDRRSEIIGDAGIHRRTHITDRGTRSSIPYR